MPLENALQSVLSSGLSSDFLFVAARAPALTSDSEMQLQFQISVIRLSLLVICPGMVWLLWNSTLFTEKKRNAAITAGMVRCLFSLGADLALVHAEDHRYTLDNLLYQGVPVDAHLIYGCVLGTGLCLLWEQAWSTLKLVLLVVAMAAGIYFNRWCAGPGHIITPLSTNYQNYDLVVQCALPIITVFFYKLIDENRALILRSVIYALGYFAVFYFLIPSIILSMALGEVIFPASKWQTAVVAVAALSVPGAWAAGQFAVSGRGTPLGLDPTHKLIVTGPYAYVRNPMQISCAGVAIVWAATTNSTALWVYVGALLVALQIARIYEEDDLHRRFGERYKKYCRRVWLWLPRLWAYEEEV